MRPFRQLTLKGLHTAALKNIFKLTWNKFFKVLDLLEGVNMPAAGARSVSEGELSSLYDELLTLLRTRYSYCFAMTEKPHITWTLGTWALRTSRSEVIKRGSDEDKAFLAAPTQRNLHDGRSNSRKRTLREYVMYPNRRDSRNNNSNNNNNRN